MKNQSGRVYKGFEYCYTQVPNAIINNKLLGLHAKGLYTYMVSKPDGWVFSLQGFQSQLKESKPTIIRILNELEKYGYVKKIRRRKDGRQAPNDYIIYAEAIKDTEDNEDNNAKNKDEKEVKKALESDEKSTITKYDKSNNSHNITNEQESNIKNDLEELPSQTSQNGSESKNVTQKNNELNITKYDKSNSYHISKNTLDDIFNLNSEKPSETSQNGSESKIVTQKEKVECDTLRVKDSDSVIVTTSNTKRVKREKEYISPTPNKLSSEHELLSSKQFKEFRTNFINEFILTQGVFSIEHDSFSYERLSIADNGLIFNIKTMRLLSKKEALKVWKELYFAEHPDSTKYLNKHCA